MDHGTFSLTPSPSYIKNGRAHSGRRSRDPSYSGRKSSGFISDYLGNISPVPLGFDDPLGWWKASYPFARSFHADFHLLLANAGNLESHGTGRSRYSRDSRVSISVERLFSSVKRTLTDSRSSMTAETASLDIITKEWLKCGLAEGVDYMAYLNPARYILDVFKIYSYPRSKYDMICYRYDTTLQRGIRYEYEYDLHNGMVIIPTNEQGRGK